MVKQILVRDVPEAVHEKLSAAAKKQNQSLQAFLNAKLSMIAEQVEQEEWLESILSMRQSGIAGTNPTDADKSNGFAR